MVIAEKDFVVCRKAVGLDSEHEVPRQLREKLGGEIYPVHRLDLNVGGLMVYARSKKAAAQLSRLIQEGQLKKSMLPWFTAPLPRRGILLTIYIRTAGRTRCSW